MTKFVMILRIANVRFVASASCVVSAIPTSFPNARLRLFILIPSTQHLRLFHNRPLVASLRLFTHSKSSNAGCYFTRPFKDSVSQKSVNDSLVLHTRALLHYCTVSHFIQYTPRRQTTRSAHVNNRGRRRNKSSHAIPLPFLSHRVLLTNHPFLRRPNRTKERAACRCKCMHSH
ncbi:uncharacterized protein EI97DRAFT_78947 [Westerdykella ornata]|uniref:Secreted protein n=1 Tax=Westerdykella ornata TaxID=318751 RepID=A0A6A6JFW5_WESOR|nr:uncharacterized protein EI97DRAFT_78947 [Westerdykella ornata]KAF2275165.1 hypothetical protein EI97DRAFT_78947 [Westerdykella ornata]